MASSNELVCKVRNGVVLNTNLCLFKDYNKFDLPIPEGVNLIDIGIDITDVLRINDKVHRLAKSYVSKMFCFQEYGIEYSSYFNVMWKEPRLHIPQKYLGNKTDSDKNNKDCVDDLGQVGDDTLIPVNLDLVKMLWLPNIFIYNLKTFKVVSVLSKHAGLWITREKEIMYSQATQINFICPMRFDNFPLDTQVTSIHKYTFSS